MRYVQLDSGDATFNPAMLLLLNKNEIGTLRAMQRIAADLASYRYPGADQLLELLAALYDDCGSYLEESTNETHP